MIIFQQTRANFVRGHLLSVLYYNCICKPFGLVCVHIFGFEVFVSVMRTQRDLRFRMKYVNMIFTAMNECLEVLLQEEF